jgi:hypothetical protein
MMMTSNIYNSRPSSVCFLLFFCGFLISLRFLVQASWVDPDTPIKSRITESLLKDDSRQFKLIFSDEFEQDGRNFHDGNDPRWTALHKNDCECFIINWYRIVNCCALCFVPILFCRPEKRRMTNEERIF